MQHATSANRPNIILILIDSLRRDHLGAYGAPAGTTPNLDRLAGRAHVFQNHFVGSLPSMPARREIFTGRREFLWRPWGPLEPFDEPLPRLLTSAGYRTGIVTDHYHYWEPAGNGYLQSFESTTMVRGHELDNWRPPVGPEEEIPSWVENIERWRPGQGRRYYANVRDFRGPEDYFSGRVVKEATDWLERNSGREPFFLQVESFDVHEPLDVPEPYASLYGDPGARERFTIWPPYQNAEMLAKFIAATSEEELEFIRSQYRAKVTMTDHFIGELFSSLDRLRLWERTAVILTTDHGHDLAERAGFGKQYPHFDTHACVPLIIWHPGFPAHATVPSLTTTADLFATIADIAEAEAAPGVWSRSLQPLVAGREESEREAVIYGTFGQGICCTDGTWTLFKSPPQPEAPLYYYSALPPDPPRFAAGVVQGPWESGPFLPGVDTPLWKLPVAPQCSAHEDFLFNREDDPRQEQNLWDREPKHRKRMLELLRQVMDDEGCPHEQFLRLGLEGH